VPETYASRCCANVFNTANVRFLCLIVARVSWSSVDNSCTCVAGVNAGTIQFCGSRLAEQETRYPFVSGTYYRLQR
jgi:hypothetical protein